MRFHPQKIGKIVPLHFQDGFQNDLGGIYIAGSYYGIRYVKESAFLLSILRVILHNILYFCFLFFILAFNRENTLFVAHLKIRSLPNADLQYKYTTRLSFELYGEKKCYCDAKPPPHFTYSFSKKPNERAVSNISKQHYKFHQMKVFRYDILQAYKTKLD